MSRIRFLLSLLAFGISLALLGAAAGLFGIFLRVGLGALIRLLK